MRRTILPALLLACISQSAAAFIEAPHSLGRICRESTHIVLVEVARIDEQRNLIIYKKIKDLKGNHPQDQLKHNIGQRGSHAREWKNVMAWARVGRRAVFFHNGTASVTGIDQYWYQCFKEGDWWAMTHAEPFLLRTYFGSAERLTAAVTDILAGKETVVPAMVDGDKEQFHLRTGKVHRIRASLKLQDYNAKRDFVAAGAPEEKAPSQTTEARAAPPDTEPSPPQSQIYRAINLNGPALVIGGQKWEGKDAPDLSIRGQRFENQKVKLSPRADDAMARMIRSSIWGERCRITLRDVPAGAYQVYLYAWEDNDPQVFDVKVNGKTVLSRHNSGPAGRWARLGPWKVSPRDGAIIVESGSSAHANFSGIEVRRAAPATANQPKKPPADQPPGPKAQLVIDKAARSVTIPCAVAPRKLPHLDQVYPLEVVATWPAPRGQKAHETVVTITGINPGEVHAALEQLGLKPGKPARGEDARAKGPELKILLELPAGAGKSRRVPIDQALVHRGTGKPLDKPLTWHFTGSVLRQPDPEKDEKAYGADITGTFAALFPVTDDVVIQSGLTMKDEPAMKLEVNKELLPAEGAPLRLVIQAK